jgi:hypothetical protein
LRHPSRLSNWATQTIRPKQPFSPYGSRPLTRSSSFLTHQAFLCFPSAAGSCHPRIIVGPEGPLQLPPQRKNLHLPYLSPVMPHNLRSNKVQDSVSKAATPHNMARGATTTTTSTSTSTDKFLARCSDARSKFEQFCPKLLRQTIVRPFWPILIYFPTSRNLQTAKPPGTGGCMLLHVARTAPGQPDSFR